MKILKCFSNDFSLFGSARFLYKGAEQPNNGGAEKVDTGKRERDLKIVRESGLLKLLQGDDTAARAEGEAALRSAGRKLPVVPKSSEIASVWKGKKEVQNPQGLNGADRMEVTGRSVSFRDLEAGSVLGTVKKGDPLEGADELKPIAVNGITFVQVYDPRPEKASSTDKVYIAAKFLKSMETVKPVVPEESPAVAERTPEVSPTIVDAHKIKNPLLTYADGKLTQAAGHGNNEIQELVRKNIAPILLRDFQEMTGDTTLKVTDVFGQNGIYSGTPFGMEYYAQGTTMGIDQNLQLQITAPNGVKMTYSPISSKNPVVVGLLEARKRDDGEMLAGNGGAKNPS